MIYPSHGPQNRAANRVIPLVQFYDSPSWRKSDVENRGTLIYRLPDGDTVLRYQPFLCLFPSLSLSASLDNVPGNRRGSTFDGRCNPLDDTRPDSFHQTV